MPFTFSPLPHTEARDRIAGLPLVTREVMDGLLPELKAYAFCITGIDRFDQLARIREEISQVPAGEQTWITAKKNIAAELSERLGGKEAERRAELLLRTHTFRGYAASRYRSLMAQREVFPYWQYKTHGDGRVRPSHAALNGRIFPAGHPVWQRIFPPWDWGCRCLVVPMMKAEVGRMNHEEEGKAIENRRVWDGDVADAIDAGARLPNGISLLPSQTWGSSPWSEPGTVRHTWSLVQQRYAQDPETLAAFEQWARATRMDDLDMTVWQWITGKVELPIVTTVATAADQVIDQAFSTLLRESGATGVCVTGDRDLVEDTTILLWAETDASGQEVLRARLRLTEEGWVAIKKANPKKKEEIIEWQAAVRQPGQVVRQDRPIHNALGMVVQRGDVTAKLVPWTHNEKYALRGYMELTLPGSPTPEAVQTLIAALGDMGVPAQPPTADWQRLLYLRKGLELAAPKIKAWRTIADAKTSDEIKAEKLEAWAMKRLKIPREALAYAGRVSADGRGWRTWARFDLTRDQVEEAMQGYRLTHALSGKAAEVLRSILAGGGQVTSTVERLRQGIPIASGMSPYTDMETGGAAYFFTRIKPLDRAQESLGLVFKQGLLSRMDAFSFAYDRFGDVRPPTLNAKGEDPRQLRATTVADWVKHASNPGNEVLFKHGLSLLDDIDTINVLGSQRPEILSVFAEMGIDKLPDGRRIEDIVIAIKP